MASDRDKSGRPVVVVTGMGVVTLARRRQGGQLGQAGGGTIRHPRDHALLDRGPQDEDRRHRRFRRCRAHDLAGARRPICRQGGRGSGGAIGDRRRGPFPRPIVPRGGAGRGRMAAAPGARQGLGRERGPSLQRSAAGGRDRQVRALSRSFPVRLRGRRPGAEIRHRRRADLAVDRLRVGRGARSSSASKRSAAARPTPRCASRPTARSTWKA